MAVPALQQGYQMQSLVIFSCFPRFRWHCDDSSARRSTKDGYRAAAQVYGGEDAQQAHAMQQRRVTGQRHSDGHLPTTHAASGVPAISVLPTSVHRAKSSKIIEVWAAGPCLRCIVAEVSCFRGAMAWATAARVILAWSLGAGCLVVIVAALIVCVCRRFVFGGRTEPNMYSVAFFHPYWYVALRRASGQGRQWPFQSSRGCTRVNGNRVALQLLRGSLP
jgi:hypothetical protein